MSTKKDELDKLKDIIDIHDFEHVSINDIVKIDKMAAQGKLSLKQIELLAEAIPDFINYQKATIQALQETIAAVRDTQKQAIYAVSKSLDSVSRILEQLASGVQTDEARMQMAKYAIEVGNLGLEVAKLLENMNKDNNATWKYIAGVLGVGITIGVIYIFASRGGSGGEN